MIEHPAILMFAGAAIGGAVATFYWWPHLAIAQRALAELRGRAEAVSVRCTELAERANADADTIRRLNYDRGLSVGIWVKLQKAQETLNAAAAQTTMAGARKVIAEGLERVRCAGQQDQENSEGGE